MEETLPDYTDSLDSRRARHDLILKKTVRLLEVAGLDPLLDRDVTERIDIMTRASWEGRNLFEVKTVRADGTIWISQTAWFGYTRAEHVWIVIGEHHSGDPYMIVGVDELRTYVRSEIEEGPSGDPGYRFSLSRTNTEKDGLDRYRRLTEQGFFNDPTDLVGTLWCQGCTTFKPDEEFARNTTMPHRRYRQVNCRSCDRPVSAGGIRPDK